MFYQISIVITIEDSLVRIKVDDTWQIVAHWNATLSRLIFAQDDTIYETRWKELMHWLLAIFYPRGATLFPLLRQHIYSHKCYSDTSFNWHTGCRLGEALHPGPLSIASANITSLLLHYQHFYITTYYYCKKLEWLLLARATCSNALMRSAGLPFGAILDHLNVVASRVITLQANVVELLFCIRNLYNFNLLLLHSYFHTPAFNLIDLYTVSYHLK